MKTWPKEITKFLLFIKLFVRLACIKIVPLKKSERPGQDLWWRAIYWTPWWRVPSNMLLWSTQSKSLEVLSIFWTLKFFHEYLGISVVSTKYYQLYPKLSEVWYEISDFLFAVSKLIKMLSVKKFSYIYVDLSIYLFINPESKRKIEFIDYESHSKCLLTEGWEAFQSLKKITK